jgi:cytochrome b pre-mRNA-processing protein 3
MAIQLKQSNKLESKLYNKILSFSRNKLFYTTLNLEDSFQNRIYLIFLHTSFIFIKSEISDKKTQNTEFNQRLFDFIFTKIDDNMREIGYGDTIVNKNMKFLIKNFYNILLNCENYNKKSFDDKNLFLNKYLTTNCNKNNNNNKDLVGYFNKYQTFCLDLTRDKVLKGELNFNNMNI